MAIQSHAHLLGIIEIIHIEDRLILKAKRNILALLNLRLILITHALAGKNRHIVLLLPPVNHKRKLARKISVLKVAAVRHKHKHRSVLGRLHNLLNIPVKIRRIDIRRMINLPRRQIRQRKIVLLIHHRLIIKRSFIEVIKLVTISVKTVVKVLIVICFFFVKEMVIDLLKLNLVPHLLNKLIGSGIR